MRQTMKGNDIFEEIEKVKDAQKNTMLRWMCDVALEDRMGSA